MKDLLLEIQHKMMAQTEKLKGVEDQIQKLIETTQIHPRIPLPPPEGIRFPSNMELLNRIEALEKDKEQLNAIILCEDEVERGLRISCYKKPLDEEVRLVLKDHLEEKGRK